MCSAAHGWVGLGRIVYATPASSCGRGAPSSARASARGRARHQRRRAGRWRSRDPCPSSPSRSTRCCASTAANMRAARLRRRSGVRPMAARRCGLSVGGMTGRAVACRDRRCAGARPAPRPALRTGAIPPPSGVAQEGVFRFPQAVAYDASGDARSGPAAPAGPYVYVADQHSFFVQKFTADGRFVRRFGGYGSEPGHFGATSASASPTTGTVGGIGGVGRRRPRARVRARLVQLAGRALQRRAASSRASSATFGAAPGQLNPGINGGLALLGDELYVGDQDNDRVQRFHLGPDGRPDGAAGGLRLAGQRAGAVRLRRRAGHRPGARPRRVRRRRPQQPHPALHRGRRVRGAGGHARQRAGPVRQPLRRRRRPRRAPVRRRQPEPPRRAASTPRARVRDRASAAPACGPGSSTTCAAIAVAPGADAAGGVFATNTSLNQISEFGVDGAFVRALGRRRPRAGRVHAAARRRGGAQWRHRGRRHPRRPRAGAARERRDRDVGADQRRARHARPAAAASASSATRAAWRSTRATATSGSPRAAATACSGSLRAATSTGGRRPTAARDAGTRARAASGSRSGSRSRPTARCGWRTPATTACSG